MKKMVHKTQHTQPMTKPKDQPTHANTVSNDNLEWQIHAFAHIRHITYPYISFVESLNLHSTILTIPQQTSVKNRQGTQDRASFLSSATKWRFVTQQHQRNCSWQSSTLRGAIPQVFFSFRFIISKRFFN